MAGLNVGELYARLGFETKEFKSGVKTAKKEAKELGDVGGIFNLGRCYVKGWESWTSSGYPVS